MGHKSNISILLVEDDEADVLSFISSMDEQNLSYTLRIAENGFSALNILCGKNGVTPIKKPFIILLDLDMPKMNGFEFLDELRSNSVLKDSIVFILTSSTSEVNYAKAYDKYVAGYIVKSDLSESFARTMQSIEKFSDIQVL